MVNFGLRGKKIKKEILNIKEAEKLKEKIIEQ